MEEPIHRPSAAPAAAPGSDPSSTAAALTAAARQAQRRLGERRRPRRGAAWSSKDVLRAAALVFALYFGLQLLWLLHPLILTGFVGLLFGLGVSRGADYLERVRVPRGLSAALLVFGTYGVLVGALALAAPRLETQFGELRRRLPEAVDRVDQWLAANRGSIWGQILEGSGAAGEAAPAAQPNPLPPPTPASRPKSRRGGRAATARASAGVAAPGAPAAGAAAPGTPEGTATPGTATPGSLAAASGAIEGGASPQGAAPQPASPATPQAPAREGGVAASGAAAGTPSGAAAQGAARGPGASSGASGASAGSAAPPMAASGASPAPGQTAPGSAGLGVKASPLRVRLARQLGVATRYLFPFLSSTVEVLVGLLLITFVAIFFSVDPDLYRGGLLRLVPHPSRPRADEVMTAIGVTLRRWLASQLIAMVIIGTLVWVALALLGVEAALSLGIIAGVFEFIPTVGSILASLPAIAMGFLVSPQKALAVAIVFTLVQLVEGHLIIPVLMKRGMNLPPLLTILGQAAMAVVFGFLGLLVAVPLVATLLTAVKMLYVNDVMGDEMPTGTGVT